MGVFCARTPIISCLNRTLMPPRGRRSCFKDLTDHSLEAVVTSMAGCQTIAVWTNAQSVTLAPSFTNTSAHSQLELLPTGLHYFVNALEDTLSQISKMSLLSIHTCGILWLKCWYAEFPCRKRLKWLLIDGKHLFGPSVPPCFWGIF